MKRIDGDTPELGDVLYAIALELRTRKFIRKAKFSYKSSEPQFNLKWVDIKFKIKWPTTYTIVMYNDGLTVWFRDDTKEWLPNEIVRPTRPFAYSRQYDICNPDSDFINSIVEDINLDIRECIKIRRVGIKYIPIRIYEWAVRVCRDAVLPEFFGP